MVRQVGRGQDNELRFYSNPSEKPLERFNQRNDSILPSFLKVSPT